MKTIDRIREHVFAEPDRIAYRSGPDSISYGDLWKKAEKGAAALRHFSLVYDHPSPSRLRGPAPVMLDGSKSPDTAAAIIACLIAGIPYVPVAPSVPPVRFESMVRQTGARLLLASHGFPEFGLPDLKRIPPEDIWNSDVHDYSSEVTAAGFGTSKYAYIIFTSGTTGEPKGVPVYRESLDNFAEWIGSYPPLVGYRNITVLNQALFSFDLSAADFFYSLAGGHTIAAFRNENELKEILSEIDAAVITPSFLRMLLLDRDFCSTRLPRLKCVWLCGEVLSPSTARQALAAFPDLTLINAYGPTESCCAVCSIRITKSEAENSRILPVGEISSAAADITVDNGEIVIRGKSVFGGYLGGIDGGHFRDGDVDGYRTGDIGIIKNEKLYCCGRKDGQIKYKGYRIELSDIESNLANLPRVTGCAVTVKRKPDGEVSAIRAFVTVSDDGVTPDGLKHSLSTILPDYMIPKVIRIIEQLPVTENGKIDRKKLETL